MRIPKKIKKVHIPVYPWKDCIAKTYLSSDGEISMGRTVYSHCSVVGDVAQEIINSYAPAIRDLYPKEAPFLVSLHDIGKVTPLFQQKIKSSLQDKCQKMSFDIEKAYQYHGGASFLTLKECGVSARVAWILGSHHGVLEYDVLNTFQIDSDVFGGTEWQQQRKEFFEELKKKFSINAALPNLNEWQLRVLGGLTQQADWIGSGHVFDYPDDAYSPLIAQAVSDAGYRNIEVTHGLSFDAIFGFKPREAQTVFYESVKGPGVYILEAPMGIGKTEAALYAAYKILESGKANGLYFALPTCLTSEKIKERVDFFLEKILKDSSDKAFLIEGARALKNLEGGDFNPGEPWFSNYHRRILAHFGVGTIDQALLSVMLGRRSLVTLSGLAGKVVILDEVHTYDAYTGTLLERMVHALSEIGCTVIILSATLTHKTRCGLLKTSTKSDKPERLPYPLVTTQPIGCAVSEISVPNGKSTSVSWRLVGNGNEDAYNEAISRALKGEQVLWIENTVADAQEVFSILSARLAGSQVDVGILHSKYLPSDRNKLESKWVGLYGKNGWNERNKNGRILVGTQVLEQSLDIDADFLVTRLAPVDMLLQRLGRLWRHAETPRPLSAFQECWILTPGTFTSALGQIPNEFKSTFIVYHGYFLLRTLEVLEKHQGNLLLPNDMRALIESVYKDRDETGQMASFHYAMVHGTRYSKGTEQKVQLANVAAVTEGCSQTRISDPTISVYLWKSCEPDSKRKCTVVVTLTGERLELPWENFNGTDVRSLAGKLDRDVIRMRKTSGVPKSSIPHLKSLGLNKYIYLGDDDESSVWIATIEAGGRLRTVGGNFSEKGVFYYENINKGGMGLKKVKL